MIVDLFCQPIVIRQRKINLPHSRAGGLVGVAGFEPTASKSQTSRATNCATPRWVKIFNFSVKSVSGQICGQKFFAETHGGEKARTREGNGDFASFRRSACEAASASQMRRAINCATPRFIDFCKISDFEFLYFEFPFFERG